MKREIAFTLLDADGKNIGVIPGTLEILAGEPLPRSHRQTRIVKPQDATKQAANVAATIIGEFFKNFPR